MRNGSNIANKSEIEPDGLQRAHGRCRSLYVAVATEVVFSFFFLSAFLTALPVGLSCGVGGLVPLTLQPTPPGRSSPATVVASPSDGSVVAAIDFGSVGFGSSGLGLVGSSDSAIIFLGH